MKKKKLKNLRTGAWSRGFSLASLGLKAGAKAAGHAARDLWESEAAAGVRKKAHMLEQAAMLAKELGELKGSLMKAGQMLSVYGEHFLPPEVNVLLKTLHNDSPPVEWEEIRKILQRQLGKERLQLLEVEEEAYAAASLGQVHRARVRASGEEIVLKIQYPGVDKAIDGDIRALRRLLSLTEWLPKIPATDELFAEVKSMLKHELDYERELKMLEFFRTKLESDARFLLPAPMAEFCSKRVLAMSFEPGETIDRASSFSQERRNRLAEAVLDLFFRELFEWRRVQTDPHFGNYGVREGKGSDRLVLYDYGAVRELPASFVADYREMLSGIYFGERARFESGAARLGVLFADDPEELKNLFHSLCSAIVEPFLEAGPYDWQGNELPKKVSRITWELVKKFPLRSPPREVVFLDRKMAGIFTFLSVLKAKINAREILGRYLEP